MALTDPIVMSIPISEKDFLVPDFRVLRGILGPLTRAGGLPERHRELRSFRLAHTVPCTRDLRAAK
jgi:hypothetical protein